MVAPSSTYDSSSRGNVHLEEVLPAVPAKVGSEESSALINTTQTTEGRAVAADDNTVGTCLLHTNTVVGEAVRRVEVEDPKQTCSLKNNDLVTLVLEGDVGLR